MTFEFELQELGEGIEQADVVNVLVEEGHVIQAGQNVVELETEKAVVEVPCPEGGRVVKVHVAPGDKVSVGAAILTIETEKGGAVSEKKAAPAVEEAPAPSAEPEQPPVLEEEKPKAAPPPPPRAEEPAEEPLVTEPPPAESPKRRPAPEGPATRRLARELGVDLHQVSGSGPGGRITAEDVRAFVKKSMTAAMSGLGAAAPPPLPDFSQWGPVERQPLGAIRRKTAEHMAMAWQLVPHVTQYDAADITELEAVRKRYAVSRGDAPGKVTVTVLAVKAAMAALRAYPQFNASLDAAGGQLIFKKYYHIGVAVDTEHGLFVPVLRDVDRKSVVDLAVEIEQLAERARQRKLGLEEMKGGTFTITNLGGIGGTAFSPIVNYPEVAILGISRARKEQVVRQEQVEQRILMPVSLSYDHRVIDGADGARFLRKICEVLSDPMQLLLEA